MGFWQITGLRWADREIDEARVGRGIGDDVEEVDVLPPQQLLRVVVDGADAQLAPEGLGLRARAVVERHAPGPRRAPARRRAGSAPRTRFREGRIEGASWRGGLRRLRSRRDAISNAGRLSMEHGVGPGASPGYDSGEGSCPPSQETPLQMIREDPRCTASPSPSCWP